MNKPIPDHPYHKLTNGMLRYIIKDAGEAAECMRGFDFIAECKYLDQVNDACTVLRWRHTVRQNNLSVMEAIRNA